jgi:uncharacterized protein (DUF2235 family)
MARRIVFSFDGTWNSPDNPARLTNVWRFHDAVVDQAPDGTAQVRWYDRGVDTDLGERLRGGAFGVGRSENIREGYRALMDTYEDGDAVYIFGFSRGAYSARSLVGLIRKCGLVRRETRRTDSKTPTASIDGATPIRTFKIRRWREDPDYRPRSLVEYQARHPEVFGG